MPGYWFKQVFNRFLAQHTLIASTIDCQLSLEYNEPIRTQFRSDSLQILHLKFIFFLCINCLCNKICFRSLCCPLSVQNYHKLKRIHANIVQNPTFLERFQTFGGQCIRLHANQQQVFTCQSYGNDSHIFSINAWERCFMHVNACKTLWTPLTCFFSERSALQINHAGRVQEGQNCW